MMNEQELVDFININSQMGITTVKKIISLTSDKKFSKLLRKQLNFYNTINQRINEYCKVYNIDKKEFSDFSKLKTYLAINFQTINDKSVSNLSKLMITGTTMGVVECIRREQMHYHAGDDVLSIITDLRKFEEESIESLKRFL